MNNSWRYSSFRI